MSEPRTPFWKSIPVIVLGIVLAMTIIGMTVMYLSSLRPDTSGLAYRIDAEQTLSFIKTNDPDAWARFVQMIKEPTVPPSFDAIPEAVAYELALLTGTGGYPEWIMSIHMKNGSQKTIASVNEAQLLLTPAEMRRSLGFSSAFSDSDSTNTLYIKTDALPFQEKSTKTLARSLLSPFESAVMTWHGTGGQLILTKKEPHFSANRQEPLHLHLSGSSVFTLEASNAAATIDSFASGLEKENAGLATGLAGIMQEKLQSLTARSDLHAAMDDIFAAPLTIAFVPRSTGVHMIALGQMEQSKSTAWLQAIRSMKTDNTIRTRTFLDENTRTEVMGTPEITGTTDTNGWTITEMQSMSVAMKGTRVIVSDDPSLLMEAMNDVDHARMTGFGPRIIRGEADITWITENLGNTVPFLRHDLQILRQTVFSAETSRISWEAIDSTNAMTIWFEVK